VKENHFVWLTLALVALMVIGALSRELPDFEALWLLKVSAVVLLLIALLSLRGAAIRLRWFMAIIGLMVLSAIGGGIEGGRALEFTFVALMLVYLLLAAWLVARQVLLTGAISFNNIVGSIALYLLIGQAYSILYVFMLLLAPGSIGGVEQGPWFDLLPATSYFSFVTLTTLGYGDIYPVSPLARVMVILEAVTGMFYMAIVVATLVGAFLRDRHSRKEP